MSTSSAGPLYVAGMANTDDTNVRSLYPLERSFVIAMRRDSRVADDACAGRIEHLASGQSTSFEHFQQMLDFIARHLSVALLVAAVFIAGCSSDDSAPPSEPPPVQGLCPVAFEEPGTRALVADPTPAPVKLSDCTLDANRNVTIGSAGCGPNVYVDQSFTGANGLGAITIAADGALAFLDKQSTQLDTSGIVVDGKLRVGTTECAIGDPHTAVINFTDERAVAGVTKGIAVNPGGTLTLHGKSGVASPSPGPGANPQAPSWTFLAAPAGPPSDYGDGTGVARPVAADGDSVIRVADTVDWNAGDWIIVAGTDFSPDSAEFVRIAAVSCAAQGGGCTITLDTDTPLRNYHFGSKAPDRGDAAFDDGFEQNYGVDERAEVGLISRNVKLTSTITGGDPSNGGEIMVMEGFRSVFIEGVELEKFGKGQFGHYPIHFHMAKTIAPGSVLVDSNSVHHSYNKCFVLHDTNGVTIENNVCARAVGHLFYTELGTELDDHFLYNLGIGAMSNQFGEPPAGPARESFWKGDYLVNGIAGAAGNGYNGFGIPFADDHEQPKGMPQQAFGASNTASGFWITSLGGNTFVGNSISGCQGLGRGFWILPATPAAQVAALAPGAFAGNRAHGCYTGFDTAGDDGVKHTLLYTPRGKCLAGPRKDTGSDCDVVTELESITATRNRNRGVWVRASWYALTDARLATNRDGVSLVSSGGTEGSPPGEWGLLRDAIIVGLSANNPLRFGPCPFDGQNGYGGNAGCYEVVQGNGYPTPTPSWNLFGVMFYDGPARIERVRFVNFKRDVKPYLTAFDAAYLQRYSQVIQMPCQKDPNTKFVYEGDAAMGWFQSNSNSYPPTQYVEDLAFENVDLRHQIYTESVENTCAPSGEGGDFRDGDKFTVILDRDRSLSGLQVASASGPAPLVDAHPISLNNIPFLAGPGTADECLSLGGQDEVLEGRPTSLISPYSYATLELAALTPPCDGRLVPNPKKPTELINCENDNVMIFTKDQIDYGGDIQFTDVAIRHSPNGDPPAVSVNCGGTAVKDDPGVKGHACVALTGRNGNGVYEPKLVNGLGYTVGASAGMPAFVSLMYGDASVPGGISEENPFGARVGLCYKNEGQAMGPPASAFTVYKGSKNFSGPNGNIDTLDPGYFPGTDLKCTGLDNVMCTDSGSECYTELCPGAPFYGETTDTKSPLTQVAKIEDLADATKCPNGECWFYDQAAGLLFINMVQEKPNAGGPYSSPLGTCDGSKSDLCAEDNFYSCPAEGCQLYTVQVGGGYSPSGPSACTPYSGTTDDYTQEYPSDLNQLTYADGTPVEVELQVEMKGGTEYPHHVLKNAPADLCPKNEPETPDWPPVSPIPVFFNLGLPAQVTATIDGSVEIANTNLLMLVPGESYEMIASAPSPCGPASTNCSCKQSFTVNANGMGFTSTGNNCCQMGTTSVANTLAIAAPPYTCTGP